MSSAKDLLNFWGRYGPDLGMHPEDEDYFKKENAAHLILYSQVDSITKQNEKMIHSRLIAQPYYGDILNARICFLFLNPGISSDCAEYQEETDPYYSGILLSAIKQTKTAFPFYPLDPNLTWTGAGNYWNKHLKKLSAFFRDRGLSDGRINELIQKEFCGIELFPYHSNKFGIPARILNNLPSVKKCKQYVNDIAADPEKFIIILRSSAAWNLSANDHISINNGGQARSGTVSPHLEKLYNFLVKHTILK